MSLRDAYIEEFKTLPHRAIMEAKRADTWEGWYAYVAAPDGFKRHYRTDFGVAGATEEEAMARCHTELLAQFSDKRFLDLLSLLPHFRSRRDSL